MLLSSATLNQVLATQLTSAQKESMGGYTMSKDTPTTTSDNPNHVVTSFLVHHDCLENRKLIISKAAALMVWTIGSTKPTILAGPRPALGGVIIASNSNSLENPCPVSVDETVLTKHVMGYASATAPARLDPFIQTNLDVAAFPGQPTYSNEEGACHLFKCPIAMPLPFGIDIKPSMTADEIRIALRNADPVLSTWYCTLYDLEELTDGRSVAHEDLQLEDFAFGDWTPTDDCFADTYKVSLTGVDPTSPHGCSVIERINQGRTDVYNRFFADNPHIVQAVMASLLIDVGTTMMQTNKET